MEALYFIIAVAFLYYQLDIKQRGKKKKVKRRFSKALYRSVLGGISKVL